MANGSVPIIGQREAQAKDRIKGAIGAMSMEIYSDLAGSYIATRDKHQAIERDFLHGLARASHAAAIAYFEGLGVIEFQHKEEESEP